jgi:hypothetical protein
MDEELTEELGKIAQRFRGKLVKVTSPKRGATHEG